MSLTGAFIFIFSSGLDFFLSLILYPIRNSLPFSSLRSVTVGSGRDFLEGYTRKGQSQGLVKPVAPLPVVGGGAIHGDVTIVEVQVERGVGVYWGTT